MKNRCSFPFKGSNSKLKHEKKSKNFILNLTFHYLIIITTVTNGGNKNNFKLLILCQTFVFVYLTFIYLSKKILIL